MQFINRYNPLQYFHSNSKHQTDPNAHRGCNKEPAFSIIMTMLKTKVLIMKSTTLHYIAFH